MFSGGLNFEPYEMSHLIRSRLRLVQGYLWRPVIYYVLRTTRQYSRRGTEHREQHGAHGLVHLKPRSPLRTASIVVLQNFGVSFIFITKSLNLT
jgi:hypothetical protein